MLQNVQKLNTVVLYQKLHVFNNSQYTGTVGLNGDFEQVPKIWMKLVHDFSAPVFRIWICVRNTIKIVFNYNFLS